MPKIAVVTPYFPTSSKPQMGRSAYETLKRLQRYADIQVICPVAAYPRAEFLHPRSYIFRRAAQDYSPPQVSVRYLEYPVLPLITRPINGLTCAHRIRSLLEEYRPDLILNYWLYPEGYAAVSIARELAVPSVVGAIGTDIRLLPDPFTRWLTVRTLNQASAVLTVSRELRDRVVKLGIPEDKVHAVLNGCDANVFHPVEQAEARVRLGIDRKAELIVYAGAFIPNKGLRELKQAFCRLLPAHPRLQLVLLGAGPLEKELAGPGVVLPGMCDAAAVALWMNAADVFTLPSHSEGCPNVVMEALSCGRPVVATDVGGIPELVHGDCGILTPPANPQRLSEALEQALQRDWDRSWIARSSRRGWEDSAKETWEVCAQLLNASRRDALYR